MPQKRSKSTTAGVKHKLTKRRAGGRSNASTNPDRRAPGNAGPSGTLRSRATIRRLRMYNSKPDYARMHETPTGPARIEPDRRWFGNVRTALPAELDRLRAERAEAARDPYLCLLRTERVDEQKFDAAPQRLQLTGAEPFEHTFGPRRLRRRPRLAHASLTALADDADQRAERFGGEKAPAARELQLPPSRRTQAGQSRRIWEELSKVLDASDVVAFVLDARDPQGTRCMGVERHLARNARLKHVIFVLNKADLAPTTATAGWVRELSATAPTVALCAGPTRAFGRRALLGLLQQFASLHREKQSVSVGFIGQPNVGKSSVINTLKRRTACRAAPVPGETRVWQYVALTRRVYLIDCPGVVPAGSQDVEALALRGALRAERLTDPEAAGRRVVELAGAERLAQLYEVELGEEDFLVAMARKHGKLRRGGEPDATVAARMLILDWQRGSIPHFEPAPARVN